MGDLSGRHHAGDFAFAHAQTFFLVSANHTGVGMRLRTLTPADTIALVTRWLGHEGFDAAGICAWFSAGRARALGVPEVGVVFVGEFDDFDYVQCLCVSPSHRSHGLATAMVRAAVRPGRVVWSKVRRNNPAALAVFKKNGFAAVRDALPPPLTPVVDTNYIALAVDARARVDLGHYDWYREACALADALRSYTHK